MEVDLGRGYGPRPGGAGLAGAVAGRRSWRRAGGGAGRWVVGCGWVLLTVCVGWLGSGLAAADGAPAGAGAAAAPAGPEIDTVLRDQAARALLALVQTGRSVQVELKVGEKTISGAITGVDKEGRLMLAQFGHKTPVAFADLNLGALADLLLALIDPEADAAGAQFLTASCLYTLNNQNLQATNTMSRALELAPDLGPKAKETMAAVQAWKLAHAPEPPPVVVLPPVGGSGSLAGGADNTGPMPAGIPKPSPQIATGSWAALLKGNTHPRLLGGPAFVQALAQSKSGWAEVQTVDSLLGLGLRRSQGAIPADKLKAEIDKAMKAVAGGVTNDHQDTWLKLDHAAQVYDYFYADLSADQRQKIVTWMNGHLDGKFTIDEQAFANSVQSKIMTCLHVAYATWGDNSRAAEWRDWALKTLWAGKVAPVFEAFGQDGGMTDCGWYTHGCLWNLVQGLELARRIEKEDPFRLASAFFYRRLPFALHQSYPGYGPQFGEERFPMEGDGAQTYGGWSDYSAFTRMVLAQYYRGSGWARVLAARRHLSANPWTRTVAFFWEETPDTAVEPGEAGVAKAWLAAGTGRVYARDGWGADATWLRFECGDWYTNHQHFESGNFEIFRNAPLATESGEYISFVSQHSVNWLQRSIAHNTMLVYQPDEKWSRLRDGGKTYGNDGGQNKKFDWTVDNLAEWLPKKAEFDQGDMVAFESGDNFCYMAADCTAAYVNTKMQSFVRQIVFVHPGMIVIYDRVIATRADYAKTWLLHCHDAPTINGDTVTITATAWGTAPGGGKAPSGTLICKTLLPEKAKIEKIQGYGYHGQNYPEADSVNTPLANKWRIEVTPPTAAADDVFLHVLTTTGSMPECKVIRTGGNVGVSFAGAAGPVEVVFAGKVGGTLTVNGAKHALTAKVNANADAK